MNKTLYDCAMEKNDFSKIEKLVALNNPATFWDDVRKYTRSIKSDHSLRRWLILSELRYNELTGKVIEE